MDGLMGVARNRRDWAQVTKDAAGARRERVWTRASRTIVWHKRNERDRRVCSAETEWWSKAAAVAAGLAPLAAALGPLPATGFADHPVADSGRTVAEHVGVREAAPPAIPPGEPLTVAGRDVTAAEASALLGVAVAAPAVPEGYALQASRYFEEALTADSCGAFVLRTPGRGARASSCTKSGPRGGPRGGRGLGDGRGAGVRDGGDLRAGSLAGGGRPRRRHRPSPGTLTRARRSYSSAGLRTTVQYNGSTGDGALAVRAGG